MLESRKTTKANSRRTAPSSRTQKPKAERKRKSSRAKQKKQVRKELARAVVQVDRELKASHPPQGKRRIARNLSQVSRLQSKEAMLLAMAIALPYEALPVRPFSSSRAKGAPSATATFHRTLPLNLTDYKSTVTFNSLFESDRAPYLDPGQGDSSKSLRVWDDFSIVTFHHPYLLAVMPVVVQNGNGSMTRVHTCTEFVSNLYSSVSGNFILRQETIAPIFNESGTLDLPLAPAHFNGSKPVWQLTEQNRWFWLDASPNPAAALDPTLSTIVEVTIITDAATHFDATSTLELSRWEDGLSSSIHIANSNVPELTTKTILIPVLYSGFYSLTLHGHLLSSLVPANDRTFEIAITTTENTCLATEFILNSDLQQTSDLALKRPITSAMSVGSSLLVTNTSSALNRSGDIYASVLAQDDAWYDASSLTSDAITSYNARLTYSGPAAKGLYSFIVPDNFDFVPLVGEVPLQANSRAIYDQVNPFSKSGSGSFNGSNIIRIPMTTTSDISSFPVLYKLVFTVSYQFLTDSQLYSLSPPIIPSATCLSTLEGISQVSRFDENPIHLSDLTRALKRVASWVVTAGALYSQYSPLLSKIGSMGLGLATSIMAM